MISRGGSLAIHQCLKALHRLMHPALSQTSKGSAWDKVDITYATPWQVKEQIDLGWQKRSKSVFEGMLNKFLVSYYLDTPFDKLSWVYLLRPAAVPSTKLIFGLSYCTANAWYAKRLTPTLGTEANAWIRREAVPSLSLSLYIYIYVMCMCCFSRYDDSYIITTNLYICTQRYMCVYVYAYIYVYTTVLLLYCLCSGHGPSS